MDLTTLSDTDVGADARARINAAITAINLLSTIATTAVLDRLNAAEAGITALDSFNEQRAAAIADLASRLQIAVNEIDTAQGEIGFLTTFNEQRASEIAHLGDELTSETATRVALTQEVARLAFFAMPQRHRPGDAPAGFTLTGNLASLAGFGDELDPLSPTAIAFGDGGSEARLVGKIILATRRPVAIEPGRIYRPRYVVQRRANPSDPAGDAIVCGMAWLDQAGNVLPPTDTSTVVQSMQDLTTGWGRREVVSLFSRSPGASVLFQAPSRARYARAYVQSFGLDGVTGVQVLDLADVTEGTVLAPETADTVMRVETLESEDAGARLDEIEAQLNTPNSVTFTSKSNAASASIPETVTTVELRGRMTPGDGGGALYARATGTPRPGLDSFVSGGVTWVQVVPSPGLVASWLDSGWSAWLASLPVDGDGLSSGTVFNNGGMPQVVP